MPPCKIHNPVMELTTVRARERVGTYGIPVAIGLRKHEGRGHWAQGCEGSQRGRYRRGINVKREEGNTCHAVKARQFYGQHTWCACVLRTKLIFIFSYWCCAFINTVRRDCSLVVGKNGWWLTCSMTEDYITHVARMRISSLRTQKYPGNSFFQLLIFLN